MRLVHRYCCATVFLILCGDSILSKRNLGCASKLGHLRFRFLCNTRRNYFSLLEDLNEAHKFTRLCVVRGVIFASSRLEIVEEIRNFRTQQLWVVADLPMQDQVS